MPLPIIAGAALGAGAKALLGGAAKMLATSAAANAAGKAISGAAGKAISGAAGKAASSGAAAAIANTIGRLMGPEGLRMLGKAGSRQFMNAALFQFMTQYLPRMLSGGALGGTKAGQLLLGYNPQGGATPNWIFGGGYSSYAPNWMFGGGSGGGGSGGGGGGGGGGSLPPGGGGLPGLPGGDGGLPDLARGAGPVVSRLFGWGGNTAGGEFLGDALGRFFEDPTAYWQQQVSPDALGSGMFSEEAARRDFMRQQRRADAELDREINRENQSYIDEKLKKYYGKGAGQWAKELGLEGAGMLAQAGGEAYDLYNSVLANALMQSAASSMPEARARAYGNPIAATAPLVAGAHMARGKVVGTLGKHVGNFLKGWSDDIAGEFEKQRALRLNLDQRPSGMFMDSYYKLGKRRGRNS